MGFRPVTLGDYLDNRMDLAPGASPIVITFDDSTQSQFSMLPNGQIDPNSAIGAWKEFAEKHSDFPILASFYVLPPVPWGQKDHLPKKLAFLQQWGCEIGSHTISHTSLKKLSEEQAKQELAGSIEFVRGLGFDCRALSLPYGISPKNATLLRKFVYNGKAYSLDGCLLVGANPAPSPTSDKFDPYRIPRIQGIDGPYGVTYWLDKVAKGEVEPYVQP